MKTVIIDPGHGGIDTGATAFGLRESKVNLEIATHVRNELLRHYDVTVLMTRTADKTISLDERTNFANAQNADVYVSIHHNAGGGRKMGRARRRLWPANHRYL